MFNDLHIQRLKNMQKLKAELAQLQEENKELQEEITQLRLLNESLCNRVAAQSQLLTKKSLIKKGPEQ